MTKVFYFFYSLYLWGIIVFTFFLHYLIAPILVFFFYKESQKGYYDLSVKFLKVAYKLLGIRITLHGRNNIQDNQNYVVVSNHLSLLDIMVLMIALPLRITFFAKKELKKLWIVGTDIKRMGHEFVDRSNPRKAKLQLEVVKKKLAEGRNVLFFPEGTRSESLKLNKFKRGAFTVAYDSKKSLLPCYISGTGNILPKGSFLAKPHQVDIFIGKVIGENSDNFDDDKSLQQEAYEELKKIQTNLGLDRV